MTRCFLPFLLGLKIKILWQIFFFSMLVLIPFNLPPGFRALGFQFYGFSSEIYFVSSRTADFVIFISV